MTSLVPVKIVKISSNDTVPIIYVPKEIRQILGLKKGVKILLYVDHDLKHLVIEKIPSMKKRLSNSNQHNSSRRFVNMRTKESEN